MEDDYQRTLKGKIKILFQLEKWQDVVKLSELYNEKYGKDVEIDMMRFKSERRLSKTATVEESKARMTPAKSQAQENSKILNVSKIATEEEPLLLLPADDELVQNQDMFVINEIPAAYQAPLVEQKQDDDPFPEANELTITDPFAEDKPVLIQLPNDPAPQANELIITDPFAEDKPVLIQLPNDPAPQANELIITDPFAENEPVFSLANNEPPVVLIDSGQAQNVPVQAEPLAEEMSIVEESPGESMNTKITFDFKSNPAIAFDAEPILVPVPKAEAIDKKNINEEMKLSVESSTANSAEVLDKTLDSKVNGIAADSKVESVAFPINEQEKMLAAESFTETADEKSHPINEPYKDFLKKNKSPKLLAFNFKYLLVLILPLAAAVILWLALSGKFNLDGGDAAKVGPASVVESPLPARQKPTPKVIPAVQIPQTDEKEQLVNDKILQANNFIKNNDIFNALAVVLEAKKIKMTEPLRQLEELITKKIREDEALAVEQKQKVQSMVQSEDQDYADAETENTLAAWQKFVLRYPQSAFIARARRNIVVLEKKAMQKAEQDLQLKILQAQKMKLRSDYQNLSQDELNAILQQLGKPSVQFEQLEHGGAKVIIDFSSGLMWTLWNKPMGFDKAGWWANRIYAGYSGWRLPTVEESISLRQMGPENYAGLADFAVWTGDAVSDQSRSIWALRLPQGQFFPADDSQVFYVWAVRKAGK